MQIGVFCGLREEAKGSPVDAFVNDLAGLGVDEFIGFPFDSSAEGRARTRALLRDYENRADG